MQKRMKKRTGMAQEMEGGGAKDVEEHWPFVDR